MTAVTFVSASGAELASDPGTQWGKNPSSKKEDPDMCVCAHTQYNNLLCLSPMQPASIKNETSLPCKHTVTWCQGLTPSVCKNCRPPDGPFSTFQVYYCKTYIYVYDSWLTPTFMAGSVRSEDQRVWREAKWNCPKLPSCSAKTVNHKTILLPKGMIEIREGRNSECSISSWDPHMPTLFMLELDIKPSILLPWPPNGKDGL